MTRETRYRRALEQIANPLDALQAEADLQDVVLNPTIALRLHNDAQWLRQIAQRALARELPSRRGEVLAMEQLPPGRPRKHPEED